MMAEKYFLKWNDFQVNVSSSFKVLRQQKDFFDVTLVGDDERHISAHKIILSSSSDFFKNILRKLSHSNPLIYITGVNSSELEHVLDYIYEGEVQLFQDNLDNFLNIAQKLKIKGLVGGNVEEESKRESTAESLRRHEAEEERASSAVMKMENWQQVDSMDSTDKYIENISKKQKSVKSILRVNDLNTDDLKDRIGQLIFQNGNIWQCQQCGKASNKRDTIKRHVEIHLEGLSYECTKCFKAFNTKSILYNHNKVCINKHY